MLNPTRGSWADGLSDSTLAELPMGNTSLKSSMIWKTKARAQACTRIALDSSSQPTRQPPKYNQSLKANSSCTRHRYIGSNELKTVSILGHDGWSLYHLTVGCLKVNQLA